MKAYPEIKAQLRDIQDALQSYREMRKSLIWMAGAAALTLLIYKPVGLFGLALFGLTLWYFFRSREYLRSLRGMPCLDCVGPRAHILTFEPWVCGSCSKTHSGKRLTWADTCECKATQHSFICPECRKPIIFDDYRFERSPDTSAWLPGYPPVEATPAPPPLRPPRHIDKHLR